MSYNIVLIFGVLHVIGLSFVLGASLLAIYSLRVLDTCGGLTNGASLSYTFQLGRFVSRGYALVLLSGLGLYFYWRTLGRSDELYHIVLSVKFSLLVLGSATIGIMTAKARRLLPQVQNGDGSQLAQKSWRFAFFIAAASTVIAVILGFWIRWN